jgi:hypothetical protein
LEISNFRTFKDYFRTFRKVSKAFGSTLSKEKLLDLIAESAIEAMDAKAACRFLADRENASRYSALQDDMKELKEDIWSHRSWF